MAGIVKTIFGSFLRTVHTLWLEVMGALFLVFAAMFGFYAVQAYRRYSILNDPNGFWTIGVAAALSLLTLAFGVHSFWKARKLR